MGESVANVLEMRDGVPVWLKPQGGAQALGASILVTASMCYSPEGKGILTVRSQDYDKVTPYNKPHTKFIGKNTGGWLPQFRREAAQKRAGGRLLYRVS